MIIRFLNRVILAIIAGYVIYRIAEMSLPMALTVIVVLLILTGE